MDEDELKVSKMQWAAIAAAINTLPKEEIAVMIQKHIDALEYGLKFMQEMQAEHKT